MEASLRDAPARNSLSNFVSSAASGAVCAKALHAAIKITIAIKGVLFMSETQRVAVEVFRTLHAEGCFVLPNPWDAGTAIYLRHLGFKALATTSAGFAFSRGLSDGKVPRDE